MYFEVLGQPVTKKNSSQMVFNPKTKRWFPVPSKQYKEFKKATVKQLPELASPIEIPVNIQYTFYMNTKRLVDGLNLSEAMDDILVDGKILSDDNRDIVAGHDGTRVLYDKNNPRVEVLITEVENYEQWRKT